MRPRSSDDTGAGATLLRPIEQTPTSRRRSQPAPDLPADLRAQAIDRLRAMALLYALTYLLAAFVPPLVATGRLAFLRNVDNWLPGALSIALALAVAGLTRSRRLGLDAKQRLALPFEVASSLGIAVSQYRNITSAIVYAGTEFGGFGLSWVSVWVLLFTVVVPAPPARALLAATLSVATVPIVFGIHMLAGSNSLPITPFEFFFSLIFPNALVVLMAYVGARVVYRLGTAVSKARELGSYRLTDPLRQGGMGEVWRAEHRLLARPAAIKLVRPEILGATDPRSRETVIRRFEREAQVMALLRSPHTIELYDFGLTEDGAFYYVMELLDGFDMEDLVTQFGPLPPERAVYLVSQVCDSLAEAHEAGLIHRDVKPANVFVCRYGRAVDFVKVLDFGLVKHNAGQPAADRLTVEDVAGGTPSFMSPEQAMGEHDLDGRSDLYAVGCLLYWLLTGTVVFKGRTPMETVVMHVQREPEPPSQRLGAPVPADLEAIVLECLAKDPSARPQTADELRARLEALSFEPAWTPDRARDWWATHAGAREELLGALAVSR